MKIRNELLSQVRSYAGHTPHAAEDTLDCSLGVNPYGFPPVVKEAFAAFDPDRFYHYPHSDAPQKAIVDYWADYAFIEPENIVLTDGSVSALYLLCNILAKKGAEVVGFLPTFTDMVEYSRMMAMRYVGIPARREENWRMEVSDLVDAISGDTSLVYIDRPNNPTGQTLSLADISRVLDRCEELGVYAIVDEACTLNAADAVLGAVLRRQTIVTKGPLFTAHSEKGRVTVIFDNTSGYLDWAPAQAAAPVLELRDSTGAVQRAETDLRTPLSLSLAPGARSAVLKLYAGACAPVHLLAVGAPLYLDKEGNG